MLHSIQVEYGIQLDPMRPPSTIHSYPFQKNAPALVSVILRTSSGVVSSNIPATASAAAASKDGAPLVLPLGAKYGASVSRRSQFLGTALRAAFCLELKRLTMLVKLKQVLGKDSNHSPITSAVLVKQCSCIFRLPRSRGLMTSRQRMKTSTPVGSSFIPRRWSVRTLAGLSAAKRSFSCLSWTCHRSGLHVWSKPTSPSPLTSGCWTSVFTVCLSESVRITSGCTPIITLNPCRIKPFISSGDGHVSLSQNTAAALDSLAM